MVFHIPIIRYDNKVLEKMDDPQSYIKSHFASKFVNWIINSNYRKAVSLESWLEEQVVNPSKSVHAFIDKYLPDQDVMPKSNDEKVILVLRTVIDRINYINDGQRWSMPDYWATADETLTKTTVFNGVTYGPMEGDCEDGATLVYVLCRLLGVPRESLFIWCGSVVGGGHACCIYRPTNYPFQFAFLDWCYWPYRYSIDKDRYLYNITGVDVIGEMVLNGKQNGQIDRNYQKMWFMVNEKESFLSLNYKVK